jgi:hypothetical protein
MLELNWSGHLNHFKNHLGQTNHYLITILIGLEGVRTGKVTKEESLNVSWNPKSLEESVVRSRRFARNSALSWAIDALDAYLGYLPKKPFAFNDAELVKAFNTRSVYTRFNAVIKFCNYETDLPLSLIQLGIQWRNNLVHYHAENELDPSYKTFISKIKVEDIKERFRGLDPHKILENFEKNSSPTLKEVAGIIQSIHFVVLELDKILIQHIDIIDYINSLIEEEKNKNEINNIIIAQPDKRISKFEQFLVSKGLKKTELTSTTKKIGNAELETILNNYITKKQLLKQ